MSKVKLSASLPSDSDANGLAEISDKLVAEPSTRQVVVAVLDVARLVDNIPSAQVEAVMRVLLVEPILDAEDKATMRRLATRARERRTGLAVLPLELESELDALFGSVTDEDDEDDGGGGDDGGVQA